MKCDWRWHFIRLEKHPICLIGLGLSSFEESDYRQLSMDDSGIPRNSEKEEKLDNTLLELQRRFGGDIIKTGNEIIAEKRLEDDI